MKADGLLVSKPANLTYREAAAIPYGGLLALHFLQEGGIALGLGASRAGGVFAETIGG